MFLEHHYHDPSDKRPSHDSRAELTILASQGCPTDDRAVKTIAQWVSPANRNIVNVSITGHILAAYPTVHMSRIYDKTIPVMSEGTDPSTGGGSIPTPLTLSTSRIVKLVKFGIASPRHLQMPRRDRSFRSTYPPKPSVKPPKSPFRKPSTPSQHCSCFVWIADRSTFGR